MKRGQAVRRVAPKKDVFVVSREAAERAVVSLGQQIARNIVSELQPKDKEPQSVQAEGPLPGRPTTKATKVENTAPAFEHALQVQDQLIGVLHSNASDIESLLDRLAGPEQSSNEVNGAGPMPPQAGGCVGRVGDHNNGLVALHARLARIVNRLNCLV